MVEIKLFQVHGKLLFILLEYSEVSLSAQFLIFPFELLPPSLCCVIALLLGNALHDLSSLIEVFFSFLPQFSFKLSVSFVTQFKSSFYFLVPYENHFSAFSVHFAP